MKLCPNCGSDRLRVQMSLFSDDANKLVCARCGLSVPENLPAAIVMIIAAAPRFPKLKLRNLSCKPRKERYRAPRYRGIIDVLLKARQMRLPA